MIKKLLATALILAACVVAVAEPRRTTFQTEPESSWNKHSGAFHVRLSASTLARKFIADWERGGKPGVMPELHESTITVIPREVEFGVFLMFSNCPLDDAKTCNALITYQILSPAGETLVEQPNLPLWKLSPQNKEGVEISQAVWYTSAEASDPPGDYRVRAIVTDPASGARITLERIIRHT